MNRGIFCNVELSLNYYVSYSLFCNSFKILPLPSAINLLNKYKNDY